MQKSNTRESTLKFALFICLIDVILTGGAAAMSNSLTIMSDLLKESSDFMAVLAAYVTLHLVNRNKDERFAYGIGKLENLVSITISLLMLFSAGFIIYQAIEHLREPVHAEGTLPGIVLFICYALTGFYIWLKNVRILKQQSSPIIASQVRLWFSKACFDITMASVLILALIFDEFAWSLYLDPLASLVGAGFLIHGAWAITSSSVGDLLDVSLEEATQLVILRELVKHFDDYDALHKVRSRRSGSNVFIEIFMSFDPELKMLEVTKRIERLHDNISDSVPGAQVLIIPTRVP
jgi:cation diffusion facilitator family transporter